MSLAASEASAQSQTSWTVCGDTITDQEIIVEIGGSTLDEFVTDATVTAYGRTGTPVRPTVVRNLPVPPGQPLPLTLPFSPVDNCDLFIGIAGDAGGAGRRVVVYPDVRPMTFEFTYHVDTYIPGVPGPPTQRTETYRIVYGSGLDSCDDSFFCPLTPMGSHDDFLVLLEPSRVRISPVYLGFGRRYVDEFIAGDDWVLPYHQPTVCPAGVCVDPRRYLRPMIMPVDAVYAEGQPFTKRITAQVPFRLLSSRRYAWNNPGLALAFASEGRFSVPSRNFSATGMTFTASEPAWGWSGIRFTPGAVGTLSGVTVSGARSVIPDGTAARYLYPPVSGVTADNATVTITGNSLVTGGPSENGFGASSGPPAGTVIGANGVAAHGPAARMVVEGQSIIRGNGGYGAVATDGASKDGSAPAVILHVRDEFTSIRENSYGGVLSAGGGTWLLVNDYANVDRNDGPGARALYGARVYVYSAAGGSNTSVSFNEGGLDAYQEGFVQARACPEESYAARPNVIEGNTPDRQFFDARSLDYGTVAARATYWGPNRTLHTGAPTDLILIQDQSSTIDATLLLDSPNAPVPNCAPAASRGVGSASKQSVAALGARASVAVVALVFEARTVASFGDVAGALAMLADAEPLIESEDDRGAIFAATADLLTEARPAEAVAALEATAAGGGPERLWAQRALVVARSASGRAAEANALALALIDEPAHAAFGHRTRVGWAVGDANEAEALARLSAFGAATSETDTLGAEALASSVALVAAAFPEADLSGIAGIPPGRGPAGRSAGSDSDAARSDPALLKDAERGAEAALADGVEVYPNPVPHAASVRVSVSEPASDAAVVVYDALGRRVAVLHDGPLAAGAHGLAFEASALPAGVYVVHVRVTPEGGGTWTEVRRVTVAR